MGCLYLLTSPSGKRYVGITVFSLRARWRAHRAYAKKHNGALQAAIRKYGPCAFRVEELARMDDYECLKALEVVAIVAYGTKAPRGYNLTDGGDGAPGAIMSEESRLRRCAAQKLSFSDPERKRRHLEAQRSPAVRARRAAALKEAWERPGYRENLATLAKARWQDPLGRARMLANRPSGPKIFDGLTKVQRHRLKDVEAYRAKKNAWAKTPTEKEKRRVYQIEWRAKNREYYNEYMRARRALARGK